MKTQVFGIQNLLALDFHQLGGAVSDQHPWYSFPMIVSGPKRSPGLSSYHGRKISVLFSQYAGLSAPPSSAVYGIDPQLGNVLKILIDDEGDLPTELLISESEWRGLVVADLRDDCDYCFLPASTSVPHQAWES